MIFKKIKNCFLTIESTTRSGSIRSMRSTRLCCGGLRRLYKIEKKERKVNKDNSVDVMMDSCSAVVSDASIVHIVSSRRIVSSRFIHWV